MEGEINNLIFVWSIIIICLCYCHTIAKFINKGTPRFLCFIPIISLFFFLPLNLTTVNFSAITAFIVTWLCNFKLVLFGYGLGPLSSTLPLPLSRFIPMACLPIKTIVEKDKNVKKKGKSALNYGLKVVLFGLLIKSYDYEEHIHPNVRLLLYCFHIYLSLEIMLAIFAGLARAMVGFELEPQFDEPYLATSLQDFWGKRWNLMVSAIMHPTVYVPVRSISARFLNRTWAPLPAVLASFFVSGIMHELIFYYMGRMKTTWEVTWFFLVNGVCLGVEIMVKKAVNGRFEIPVAVSRTLTLGFVLVTTFWLFFPPFLRCKPDLKGCMEAVAFVEFVMHGHLVSPANVSCPFVL